MTRKGIILTIIIPIVVIGIVAVGNLLEFHHNTKNVKVDVLHDSFSECDGERIRIAIGNRGNRTVDAVQFYLSARIKGRSGEVFRNPYVLEYSSDFILEPNHSLDGCYGLHPFKSKYLSVDPKTLIYEVIRVEVKFSEMKEWEKIVSELFYWDKYW